MYKRRIRHTKVLLYLPVFQFVEFFFLFPEVLVGPVFLLDCLFDSVPLKKKIGNESTITNLATEQDFAPHLYLEVSSGAKLKDYQSSTFT